MKWFAIVIMLLLLGTGVAMKNSDTEDTYTEKAEITEEGEVQEEVLPKNNEKRDSSGKTLDLSGQNLQSVPVSIFNDTGIVHLDVSNNNLTGALQAEVRFLSKLETLDLSNNKFTGVPAEVGQLSNLKELNLSNNQLTGLPHEIGNLKNLQVLDLRGNNPSTFDLNIIKEALPDTSILVD